jgi:hypothetical protein
MLSGGMARGAVGRGWERANVNIPLHMKIQ